LPDEPIILHNPEDLQTTILEPVITGEDGCNSRKKNQMKVLKIEGNKIQTTKTVCTHMCTFMLTQNIPQCSVLSHVTCSIFSYKLLVDLPSLIMFHKRPVSSLSNVGSVMHQHVNLGKKMELFGNWLQVHEFSIYWSCVTHM